MVLSETIMVLGFYHKPMFRDKLQISLRTYGLEMVSYRYGQ